MELGWVEGGESYTEIEQNKKDVNNIRVEINGIENRNNTKD